MDRVVRQRLCVGIVPTQFSRHSLVEFEFELGETANWILAVSAEHWRGPIRRLRLLWQRLYRGLAEGADEIDFGFVSSRRECPIALIYLAPSRLCSLIAPGPGQQQETD